MSKQKILQKDNIQDILALTPIQKGMLFHYQMNADSEVYLEQTTIRITGKLSEREIEQAWSRLEKRYDILRSVFKWEKLKEPVQIIYKKQHNPFQISYGGLDGNDSLEHMMESELKDGVDLSKVPVRIRLYCTTECKYLILTYHHILWDGWSSGILMHAFKQECLNISTGNISEITPKTTPWKEYIKWLKGQKDQKNNQFWNNYLQNMEQVHDLLAWIKETSSSDGDGKYTIVLDHRELSNVQKWCKQHRHTLAGWVHAGWGLLLNRYSMQEHIVFGSTVSGRNAELPGIEQMVGLFINSLPIYVHFEDSLSVSAIVEQIEQGMKERSAYEATPLTDIKEYCGLKGKGELFHSLLVYENYPVQAESVSEIGIEVVSVREETHYDLTLIIMEKDGQLACTFQYKQDQFTIETIEKMANHYKHILLEMVEHYKDSYAEIDCLGYEEKKAVHAWNSTESVYPKDRTMIQLFEEQVEKTPDRAALVEGETIFSYRELNARANQLARMLRESGVKTESIVGLLLDRSIEMVISIFAIHKAGGAYLPLDVNHSSERIAFMLKDSGSEHVLTRKKYLKQLKFDGVVWDIDEKQEVLDSKPAHNLSEVVSPYSLAYIIYTSGSTGKPKGVMIENASLLNTILAMQDHYPLGRNDAFLLKTSHTFDVSVAELFGWFMDGGRLVILQNGAEKDPFQIRLAIKEKGITHINFVPSMLNIFINTLDEECLGDLTTLRYIFAAGEALTSETANKCYGLIQNVSLNNIYGPTEATIYATRYAVEGLQGSFNMPIGRPLQNFKAYIMNSHHKLQPVGVPGELCIGGAGLARGYLGQEGLTDEKFISNPFMDGDRMYKTGDLARWLPDGNIQFLSRIDNQVKIRGHRIETREVESRLLEHKFIQEALVMARGDESFGQYLCAYIVSSNELRVREVRTHLRLTLPEYMIPTYIIPLDSMPLNPNGKIDRKALPQPETHLPVEAEWTAPQNEMEEKLVHIWCDILNIERVGVDHNFFELGGHSLKATILATRIHREWDTVVPLSEIFKFPTIKELATVIYQAQKNHFISIPPLEKRDYYPISSVQKRIYVLNQLDQGTAYNISGVMKLDGVLDIQQLEQAFHQLIRRHEALRTTFHMINGEIYQRIHEHVDFRISVFDGNEDSLAHMLQAFTQPFQLSEGPLLRVGLINLGEASYYLMVDMHHIISDGSSLGILMEEFARYYEGSGNLLSPLRIQYKDFAAWQNEQNQYNEKIKLQETFWLNQFNDEIPILGMPLDYPRPSVQSFEGSRIYFAVDHECNRKLKQFMNETGATLYMVLLAVYNVVLSKYTGQEDIVVGSPVAGRLHEDLHRVIGMFVNTLGMRNKPIGSKTFNMFMDEVKQNALQCFENQDYSFEALVENLDIPRDMSRNPLFDTMFVLQNKSIEICEIEGLKLSPVPFDSGESKFDLTLYAQETDQGISFELEYCTQIFKKETMERMGRHFVRVLSQVISNPDRRLSDVDMLMEDEKQRMQFDYNDTSVSYALDRTVYELFEEQVARTPEDIALVFKGCELTYEALNRKANKIARYLKNKGVGENTLVAIMAERSFEMVIGIMGILKAGAAYVPIDPDYPEERIRYLMDNSNTNILLTQESLMEKLRQEQKEMIAVEEIVRQEGLNEENLQLSYHPKRLMYVLYTSGSTGKPKGVKVRANAFTNLIHWFVSDFNITSKDHTLLIAPISFDLAQKNLYASLVSGGKLCLFTPGIYDYEEMSSTIEKQGITLMNCTPSAFNPLIDVNEDSQFNRLQSLRCIFLGGEPINLSPLKHWAKSTHYHAQIINTYGPTECTDITTSYTIDHAQIDQLTTVPIGKPIHNMKVFILDEFMKMVPTGALGELYIGGIGVADGYFNQPEITAQKFIDIPELCEGKLYRTGDIVKWLPEGTLEFLGRVDHQVKIRGMRVELGEIEARLLKHEDVKEAIVVETGKENHKHLCAYFVAVEEMVLAELKAYMEMELPMHMIPTYFIQLDHIPMTPNGKMDRKSLPAPSASSLVSNIYEAPANDTEMKLAQIWEDVLGIERVGVQDNFFELGGHSLKAISLVSKMHQALEVDIRVRDIFEGPTIRELGAKVQGGLAKKFTGLVPSQKQD
ncbi:non-ribosomal peptide synthetase, partial [Paenibacillus polymyxa]|uniref:non-ribosomal peptide synthetase n=1 Tax=Paenibacillus polymyxa TaxID=1406 RepID=UPI000CAD08AA